MNDFVDLLRAVPLSENAKQRVHDLLRSNHRFYHGVEHVTLLWHRHREHAQEAGFTNAEQSRLIACAVLFHDCVYTASRTDNEEQSALFWLKASRSDGMDDEDRTWVADTIRATQDHLTYATGSVLDGREALRLWLLDLDLSPLGEVPEVFDQNVMLLRAESPHLSDSAFQATHRNAISRFAASSRIYRNPVLAARFEAPARRNLLRHLVPIGSIGENADERRRSW